MEISEATATSLGEKLAGLDLSEEEGVLLGTLLGANDAHSEEVEGFRQPGPATNQVTLGYTEVEWTYAKRVLEPLPALWKQPGGDGYLIITMEN